MTHYGTDGSDSDKERDVAQLATTNARVMMIDDEPILIELVRAFLEEAGYQEFVGTTKPETALQAMEQQMPDVLLLDLMMPNVNGFEILESVRANPSLRHLPVIVMTSASDADTKLRVLELGATDFLEKPVDPSELILRLRNTLAFKAHRDRMTYFDAVTNLPNHRLFMNQLASGVRRSERIDTTCAMLHIDIDRFKQVNETLGHRVGDAMLKAVAQRLQSCLQGNSQMSARSDQISAWSLSRFASDEFTALMPCLERIETATAVARRMLNAMASPVYVDDHELFVTINIGIAASPEDADNPETLLRRASSALATTKERGRNTYGFYSPELNDKAVERMTLERDLRKAVGRNEFELYYQPKVDIASNRIVAAEALIRWHHPIKGRISPDNFIPLAEELGLIIEISKWVMQTACTEAVRWRNEGIDDCTVSINVSTPHFNDGRLLQDVQDTLRETGLAPSMLTLEITESMMMKHTEENLQTMESLKTLGVRMSLDDFGTGYSSLSYLKRMRVDELKIDRSFINSIPNDTDGSAIVRAILAMSQSLGFEVTAEGVEHEEQLQFLAEHNCDIYQGFLCSQPIPADNFLNLLRQDYVPSGLIVEEIADIDPVNAIPTIQPA